MSPQQVIAAFAARLQQFERIVADVATENAQSRAQHHLIVGQRGMGKTMLLARIAAELRTQPELATRFVPLVFAEEQYAVDRLSKFWLNCLDSLADECEMNRDAKGVDEIDSTVSRLTAQGMRSIQNDQPLADEVYDAFVQITKARGRRPVLLVDNLQLVFERLNNSQQHSLRELLMRPSSPILIGASPSLPPEAHEYVAAFYDQFKVHYLRPLDEAEMRSLLVHLADASQRADVRQRVLQHPSRITVLRQLTGGNPRTTLTLFFLYAEDFAPTVFGDLEGLLDRVTPLYKARLEELTPQQQVVVSAIANHWDPVTSARLAETTGLPTGTISAQLDRLEKSGVVERTELFGETSTGYQIAERFFNIWFLMRSASRRQRREVEFLTRFLESFYEPEDRSQLARHLMREDHFSPDRYVWSRAVAASLNDAATAEDLTRHAELTVLREAAREARARLQELIDFDSLPPATLAFDDLRKKLTSLVPADAEVAPEDFAKAVLGDAAMFKSDERERLAAHNGKLTSTELRSVLEAIEKTRAVDEQAYSKDAVAWFSQRLATGQIRTRYDADDWDRAIQQSISAQCIELLVEALPHRFGPALKEASIERIYMSIRPSASDSDWKWYTWGHILHTKLVRNTEAESAYREAIARKPKDRWNWHSLGAVLAEDRERALEAERCYREAIAVDPTFAWAWDGLGDLFRKRLNQFPEAEAAYRKAIACDSTFAWPWYDLGQLLHHDSARYVEAELAYREAIARDSSSVWAWAELGNLYRDHLGRLADAEQAYEKGLGIDPSNILLRHERLFLRRDLMGEGSDTSALMDELRMSSRGRMFQIDHLQDALFAAYESNWGVAQEALGKALDLVQEGIPAGHLPWLRSSAVLVHLNYGAELLTLLDRRGDTARLRPWAEAMRAIHTGSKSMLKNTAPEIRTAAELFYDDIDRCLARLPERTRRRTMRPKTKTNRSTAGPGRPRRASKTA